MKNFFGIGAIACYWTSLAGHFVQIWRTQETGVQPFHLGLVSLLFFVSSTFFTWGVSQRDFYKWGSRIPGTLACLLSIAQCFHPQLTFWEAGGIFIANGVILIALTNLSRRPSLSKKIGNIAYWGFVASMTFGMGLQLVKFLTEGTEGVVLWYWWALFVSNLMWIGYGVSTKCRRTVGAFSLAEATVIGTLILCLA